MSELEQKIRMETQDRNDHTNPRTADLSALRIQRPKEEKVRSYKWLKIIPWLLVPALLVIAYFVLLDRLKPGKAVDFATVKLIKGASAKALLSASGYVVAQRQSSVASKGTGRVTYLAVGEGDQVKTGQLIAQIESDDIKANLALAKANLNYALADSMEVAIQYNRGKKLFETRSMTQEELDTYQALYQKAIATVEARRASLRFAEIDIDNTFIRAPFDGTVINKIAEIGDIVAPFASSASSRGAVATLADMSSLEVEADVSETNIQKIRVGQPCEIVLDAYPEVRYAASVKNIIPTANRSSATIMTRIAFEKLDSLIYPEMSARVYFLNPNDKAGKTEEPSFVGVTSNAIIEQDGNKFAFVIQKNHVAKKGIEVGRTVGNMVEIKSGLKVDDKVVLTPPGDLKDGDKIKISD